jgi:hypothetical protein
VAQVVEASTGTRALSSKPKVPEKKKKKDPVTLSCSSFHTAWWMWVKGKKKEMTRKSKNGEALQA